ncbi:MAG: hypothetical protein ACXWV9_03150 [Flavisolibacter sp.]
MDVHNKVIKHVTCISIGVYEHAVSKGNIYKVFNENIENYRMKAITVRGFGLVSIIL